MISSFTSDDADGFVVEGDSVTLSWAVSNATQLTLDSGSGPFDVTGTTSFSDTPSTSTTYTLTATNSESSSVTANVTLTVGPPPLEITSFTADDPYLIMANPRLFLGQRKISIS